MKTLHLLRIMLTIACLVGWTACSETDKVLSEWEETEKEKENKPDIINTKEEPVTLKIINGRVLNDYFIKSIAFDQEGNAWIGTFKQGLIKYNGREATFFDSSNSPFSEEMVIYDLAIDSKNNVWIGSYGLTRYDGEKFTTYTSENSPLPEDFVHSIRVDSNDNLWFSSSRFKQGGLVRFDSDNQWKIFTPENSNMSGYSIKDIVINRKDEVWVSMGDYVNNASLVKVVNNKITTYSDKDFGFKPYYLGNICATTDGQVYITIDYSLSSMIHNNGPHLFSFDGYSTQIIDTPSGEIRAAAVDSKNNIWCSTWQRGEILKYNSSGWSTINVFPAKEDNSIFCIKEAPDGRLWIGTGRGIYIVEV